MSHSNQWYPPNNNNNQRDDRQRRPQDPHATHPQGPGLDVVRNGQRLLAVYPPASATPTHHVSRHIGSMTLTAAPTFPQPSFNYNASSTAYSHRNPAPYADYDQQLRYLAHPQAPSHDTGFWENTRNDAVRMLNEQAGPSYQYQEPTHWAPPAPQSSFQTPAFAQSVFQRTTNNIFPAAPPAPLNSSSSSLAFALGPLPTQTQPQAQTQYQPPPPPLQQQQHQHQPQHHIQNQSPHFHPQINSQPQTHYQAQPQPQPQYQSSSNFNVQFQQHQSHVRPPAKEYPPQESQAFFDNFVERKFQRINPPPPPIVNQPPERKERQPQQANPPIPNVNQPPERKERKPQQVDPPPPPIVSQPAERKERKLQQTNPLPAVASQPIMRKVERSITPPKPKILAPESSPDPLALHSEAFSVTPKKRKPVITMESPSIKRIQSLKGTPRALSNERDTPGKTTPRAAAAIPLTPTTNSSSFSLKLSDTSFNHVTPTHKRIVNKAYVAVPPSPWSTPASIRKMNGANGQWQSSDDLGGYGSQDDGPQSPTKRSINDSVKSSARRTGDRDERGPLEKLTSLIEDVFEAEDTLPSEMDPSDLNHDFFSPLSSDLTRPMLSVSVIRKLTKYIGHVARPTKRLRQATGGVLGTPRAKGRMADVDTQMLSRLLKFLERSVKEGEDLDPFAYHSAVAASIKSSPKKPSAKKAAAKAQKGDRPRSNTPRGTEDADVEEASVAESRASHAVGPEDEDFEQLASQLDVALESILAADCCIALLASDRLTKQLYSEELITVCLNTIKNQLTKILYPFVEASAEGGVALNVSPLLQSIVKNSHSMASPNRRQLNELFVALSAVIPRINNLVNAEAVAMSDSIIIQAVYIAIGPFFVVDPGSETDTKGKKENVVIKTLGKTAMRGLRLDALSLIRSIFANHEDQRSWIIEEILSSLIKLNDTKQKAGQYRLRDGRSIRTVSALLLQLVQTSAHDVRLDAKKFEKIRQNKFALKRQESYTETQPAPLEPFLDETDQEEIRLYGTGLDSATKAAKSIIIFLTQRSGKGKATKNSNEAEYRMIFDNLIDDLLTVLFWPEWPAAGLILSIASKFMVSSLDDVKTNAQTDSNAAKTMALDHLGVIAARIRTSVLKVQNDPPSKKGLRPLDDIVAGINLKYLNRFLDAHRDIAAHLCKRSSEDQAYDSARELTAATLGQELANALKHVNNCLQNPEADDDGVAKDPAFLDAFGQRLKISLRELWKEPATDVFDIGSQDEVARIDGLAEEIGTIQSLRNSFNPILSVILMALDAPAIFMRTKALRALGQIVTSDASILAMPSVRRGIESHLLDNSPAVRDAAVELIGKYMIDSPAVAGDYYQKIADRMADTGLSVRKRVIKLLKSFYLITDDTHRIDIALRMVLRMMDEDDTVKDLAIKTIEELWFPALPLPSAMKGRASTTNPQDHAALLSKVSVIMGTSAHFKDARQSPLEDVLHKIMGDKEGNEKNSLHARYAEICEALIDGLVDASDLPGFTVSNCIRTIYLLTSAYPSILSSTNASTLLPYLKNAGEESTSDYLLKIFKVSIPHMPKTAAKFGQELQAALQPMIIKPSGAGGVQTLQETVGCMCVVVQHLTHDFVRLVNLLKSCNGRLQQTIKSNKEIGPNDIRALIILIFIVSLLAEHCNFDNLRNENPSVAGPLNDISQGSIHEHVYNTLLTLYEKHDNATLRGRILQCLGFLFRAHPTLMTMDRSALIMDEIFASAEEEGKGRLLRIIQDFLVSEASKHSAKEKEMTKSKSKPNDVNMDELVGNTDGFADSGVSSAIVQRYLDHVLEAALSQNVQIQAVAIDVLSFTIKQGLAHPLQSFPVIVALETSPTASISNRASALHAILQGKHSSLLNTRYTVSARKSFDYQKRISPDSVRGFRMQPMPIALLQRWYSHIREKRPTRQDFLKSLVKIFQENPSYESSQDDVNYTRYMAENFSAFDYKTQEEVLTVIKYLTSVLSTTGMQLLEIISPSHLLTHLHAPSQSQSIPPYQPQPFPVGEVPDLPPVEPMDVVLSEHTKQTHNQVALMRTSVIIAVVMLLKAHLKALYSLSEDKCNKFVIGKKSTTGDKPATKRHDNPISWDRLPFATNSLHTTQDASLQKARFLEIWNEDGLTAEPEDEEFL